MLLLLFDLLHHVLCGERAAHWKLAERDWMCRRLVFYRCYFSVVQTIKMLKEVQCGSFFLCATLSKEREGK